MERRRPDGGVTLPDSGVLKIPNEERYDWQLPGVLRA
jgi:hypothetical protein